MCSDECVCCIELISIHKMDDEQLPNNNNTNNNNNLHFSFTKLQALMFQLVSLLTYRPNLN